MLSYNGNYKHLKGNALSVKDLYIQRNVAVYLERSLRHFNPFI